MSKTDDEKIILWCIIINWIVPWILDKTSEIKTSVWTEKNFLFQAVGNSFDQLEPFVSIRISKAISCIEPNVKYSNWLEQSAHLGFIIRELTLPLCDIFARVDSKEARSHGEVGSGTWCAETGKRPVYTTLDYAEVRVEFHVQYSRGSKTFLTPTNSCPLKV